VAAARAMQRGEDGAAADGERVERRRAGGGCTRARKAAGGGEGRRTGGGRRGQAQAARVMVRGARWRRTVMTGGTHAFV
jgi:hypothetical protein